jgi:hypothetical protein
MDNGECRYLASEESCLLRRERLRLGIPCWFVHDPFVIFGEHKSHHPQARQHSIDPRGLWSFSVLGPKHRPFDLRWLPRPRHSY